MFTEPEICNKGSDTILYAETPFGLKIVLLYIKYVWDIYEEWSAVFMKFPKKA